jgi:hypothetical protein
VLERFRAAPQIVEPAPAQLTLFEPEPLRTAV